MMFFILIFLASFVHAIEPAHWSYVQKIEERHEFYKNDELIDKPSNSWQLLLALVYVDEKFQAMKDCLFYKVPGEENGILKIITLPVSISCELKTLEQGDKEVSEIKSLQFAVNEEEVELMFTLSDYRSETWKAKLLSPYKKYRPKTSLSSGEFKSSPILFLAPEIEKKITPPKTFSSGEICHRINDDCEEISPSVCSQCPQGWYEVPNGCSQGPKYCGRLNCGKKNTPACRRGMKWQRKEISEYDCRTNSSFAYCSNGLKVVCEGKNAFCR